jgi:6-phosphogluconolactonase
MINRRVYADADTVARALADALLALFDRAAATPQQHLGVMLAGGRTPKAAYGLVAASGRRLPPNLTLIISDERWVPADHPDSNGLMMQPFFEAIQATPGQLLMVNTTLPRSESAADFGHRLQQYFTSGGLLDTAFLGLGADGHTASLFSADDLARAARQPAIDVDRPDGRIGISASPSVIRMADRIVFVVTGSDKTDKVRALLAHPRDVIAGQVVWQHPQVAVWLDRAAAG